MDDSRLARKVIDRGFAPAAAVQECLKASAGRDFGRELVRRGLVTAAQLAALVQEAPPTSRAARAPDITRATGIAESSGADLPPEVLARLDDPDYCFQKFVLVDELGKGGMGVVWKAWQRDLKRWVAIKFLSGGDEEELQRFLREAQTAGRLSHPNIAAVYDLGEEAGRVYIVMEFVDGASLHQMGKIDPARALAILRDAALALHHAHQEGVIHRDIKPHNLMVNRKGRTYVMDFGLAKAVRAESGMTIPGMIMGTPSFMPPEQAEGRTTEIDRRSDVYSLGATLHAAITGKPPFSGRTAVDTMYKVVHAAPPPLPKDLPGLPPDADAVCRRAMAKRKADRYPDAKALADDLDKLIRGERLDPRAARKRPTALILATAIPALLLAAGLAWWTTRGTAAPSTPSATPAAGPGLLEQAAKAESEGREDDADALLAWVPAGDPAKPEAEGRLALRHLERLELHRFDIRAPLLLGLDRSPRAAPDREGARARLQAAGDSPRIRAARALEEGRYEDALRLASGDPVSRDLKLWALLRLRRHAEAAAAADSWAATREPRALRWQVLAHFHRYDAAATRRAVEALLAIRPTDRLARRHDGHLLLKAGKAPEAAAVFARLAAEFPEDPRYPTDAAWAWFDTRDYARAVAAGEAIVARWPGDDDGWWILGLARIGLKQGAEALVDLERALRINPSHHSALLNRGAAKFQLGRYEEAAADYTQAMAADPEDPWPYFNRAVCHEKAGRKEACRADLKRAANMDAREAIQWRTFMETALSLQHYDLVLEFTERHPDVLSDVPYWKGLALVELGRAAEGVPVLEKFIRSVARPSEDVHNYLGVGLYRLKEWARAEAAFTTAMALDPRRARFALNRALAREFLGNLEGALQDLQLTLKLGTPDPQAVEARISAIRSRLGH